MKHGVSLVDCRSHVVQAMIMRMLDFTYLTLPVEPGLIKASLRHCVDSMLKTSDV